MSDGGLFWLGFVSGIAALLAIGVLFFADETDSARIERGWFDHDGQVYLIRPAVVTEQQP